MYQNQLENIINTCKEVVNNHQVYIIQFFLRYHTLVQQQYGKYQHVQNKFQKQNMHTL